MSALTRTRRGAYKVGRVLGDVQAVRRGRIGPRLVNKGLGRLFGRLWR